jgi:hypothetical protein
MQAMRTSIACLAILLPLLAAACSKPAEPKAPPAPPLPITAEVLAKLAKADALDGNVDQVVHLCAGCNLGMNGKAEYPLAVGNYTMHFCKKACVEAFRPDPAKEIIALHIKD